MKSNLDEAIRVARTGPSELAAMGEKIQQPARRLNETGYRWVAKYGNRQRREQVWKRLMDSTGRSGFRLALGNVSEAVTLEAMAIGSPVEAVQRSGWHEHRHNREHDQARGQPNFRRDSDRSRCHR